MNFVKKEMHDVTVQAAVWLWLECGFSRRIKVSLRFLAILGHDDVRVTQVVRTTSGLAPSRNIWLECVVCGRLRKYPLLQESAGDEFRRRVVAGTHGHSGMRVCTCEICNRLADLLVYRG